MSLLGIDIGTTGCKAAGFAEDGRRLAEAYREYPTLHPRDTWAELDTAQVLGLLREVVRETMRAMPATDPVSALSVSSMGEAMIPVDRHGAALGDSILSSDTRGGDLLDTVLAGMDRQAFFAINPNIPGPNYSLPKLLWIKHHQPALYQRADRFMLWGDWIAHQLGGAAVAGYTLANRTLLFDLAREDWSDELLERSGIPRAKLPPTAAPGTVIGAVNATASADWGIPEGTAIVVGGHDQCCNLLGAGIATSGKAVCGLGSFECLTPAYDKRPAPDAMLRHGLNVEHGLLPGIYVSFIYNQAGSLVKWFRDTFAAYDAQTLAAGESIYQRLNTEMPDMPTHLLVLPYFDITGPPEFVANASGVIAGLKPGTRRGDIFKAVIEGSAYYFCDSLIALHDMGIDTSEFVATGGGARSDRWLQIKADMFGVPFIRPRETEGSLLGAAMLAGIATGRYHTAQEAVDAQVTHERRFEPDPARHACYREKAAHYRRLFPIMRDFLADWETARPETLDIPS